MRVADLHLHTTFSDSTYAPLELLKRSSKSGLDAIAVVDHDTVSGIAPALESAKDLDIEVIPGIELTAEYNNTEIHILGYFIDYENKVLRERLEILRQNRIERIYKISDKLKNIEINLDAEDVFELARGSTVGRMHVARAMVKKGIVGSIGEAFKRFIGDKSPAYVLGFRISPQEAIKLIKDAGGIPVLAHPYILRNDNLIPEFVRFGIMGLEIYYPEHTQSMINFYLGLAKQYNLLVTGGSDCHGTAKPDVKIGCIKIPYELVEKLKAAKENL